MKIVCESCQAKYSIADEKIAGKVFKIRCKRCNEVILVRGDQEPAHEEASSQETQGGAGDAIWHVVIDGEQRGPFAPDQIGEMLSKSQIDWEAYVWREGMDNWLAACDIPDLVAAVMGPDHAQQQDDGESAAAASYNQAGGDVSTGGSVSTMANNPIQATSTMGADPFADNGSSASRGLFGDGASAAEAGADLFRPSAEVSPFSNGGGDFPRGDVAPMADPRVNMDQAMTGARNENSVLFSLKNLQALATGATAAPITSPLAPSQASGYATGEGSGLIDIRALATATGVSKDGAYDEDRDMLLSIGTKTGAFGALGSPIAAPAMVNEEDTSKRKMLFAILGGSIFLGMCMIAVAIIMKPSAQPQPVAPAVAAVTPAVIAPVVAKPLDPIAPPAELSEGEKAARAAAEADRRQAYSSDRSERNSRGGSKKKSVKEEEPAAAPAKAEAPAAAAPAKEEPKKKKSTGSESIDDLLSGALSGSKPVAKKSEESSPAASGLPEKPSRDDVMSALRSIQPQVSACGQGQGGVAMANIVVGNSGRVQSVQVTQVPGPVASCVARAVRGARFPKFSSPKFSVSFPFRL